MSIEIQKFSSVGFESAFVALNVQCSLLGSRQFERKTCLWTLCCISGKNLALRIFWWFYSLTIENLYFSGKGAHIVILRNHWSINNFHLLFPTLYLKQNPFKKHPKHEKSNQLFIIHELADGFHYFVLNSRNYSFLKDCSSHVKICF